MNTTSSTTANEQELKDAQAQADEKKITLHKELAGHEGNPEKGATK